VLRLASSDDELAVVIAHEIAHVSAKHVHEGLSQQLMVETGSYAVSAIPVGYGTVGSLTSQAIYSAYGLGTDVVGLSFDRDKEREADKMGLIYMARAGYDPNAAMTFWNKVDQMNPGEHPSAGWLSTHPSHANRVFELREAMPKAEGIYESVVASGVWE
jgi:predicted Zn-dependent protease